MRKFDKQIIGREFDSHWVPYIRGFVKILDLLNYYFLYMYVVMLVY